MLARIVHEGCFDPFTEFSPMIRRFFTVPGEAPVETHAPAVDTVENENAVELIADLPGLKESEIEIKVERNVLTIRGERKAPVADEKSTVSSERPHGVFERSFTLGERLDAEKISARYEAGVLHVTLQKKPEEQPRRIQVAVA
jgi:HSP20 family protein